METANAQRPAQIATSQIVVREPVLPTPPSRTRADHTAGCIELHTDLNARFGIDPKKLQGVAALIHHTTGGKDEGVQLLPPSFEK